MEWWAGDELLNEFNTVISVYRVEGKVVPVNKVRLIRIDQEYTMVIIDYKAVRRILGAPIKNPVYLSIYRDHDQPNEIECKNWFIDSRDPLGSSQGISTYIQACFAENKAGTIIRINGEELDNDGDIQWDVGDYVEVILDRNVIGMYEVNVSDGKTGYYSSKQNIYRDWETGFLVTI